MLWKIHQILHVIFETTSQFFFKLSITLQCHERWLFCTFLAETLYDFYKRSSSKSKNSGKFHLLRGISPNLYFGRLLLLKVCTISAKKCSEELCLMILKIDAKFEQKPIYCFRLDKNLVNFDTGTQKSPNFVLWLIPLVQSV